MIYRLKKSKNNYYFRSLVSYKTQVTLLGLFLLIQNLNCVKINTEDYHGIYDENDVKNTKQKFNFSTGIWYTFEQETKDGRIMEYHPPMPEFFKVKKAKAVAAIGYYEPDGRIIAFYKDKLSMPKTSIRKSYRVLNTKKLSLIHI